MNKSIKMSENKKNAVWGTSMDRADFEELNKFLKDNRITKVRLIYAGWKALKEQLSNNLAQQPKQGN